MKKVAIQGILGSFHDIAARIYFGDEISLICCNTFEQLFDIVKTDPDVVGMCAIENTIAGSLLHNYELLRDSGAIISGEQKLRISHSLCCLPSDSLDTINEIHSHPVALMQCRRFLSNLPTIKAVENDDTAGSARMIAEDKRSGWAAICHADAAGIYGLKVLQNNIEDNKHNFTRFLVVSSPVNAFDITKTERKNKASIVFSLPHEEGSLSSVLAILSFYKINLTKIQSLPIIGREWEYLFYVDVVFNDIARYHQAIHAVTPLTKDLRILGEYCDGKQAG